MKLHYYDEVTPPDYEPPYFKAGDIKDYFYFPLKPDSVNVGKVETGYHNIDIIVESVADLIHSENGNIGLSNEKKKKWPSISNSGKILTLVIIMRVK